MVHFQDSNTLDNPLSAAASTLQVQSTLPQTMAAILNDVKDSHTERSMVCLFVLKK